MNFTTTIEHNSTTTPGVKFAVRRMTEGSRLALRIKLAPAFAKLRAIDADRQDLIEEAASRLRKDWDKVLVAELTSAERRQLAELVEREALVRDTEIDPAYLDAGLASIDGLALDGEAITDAAGLRRVPSPELFREIKAAVLAASGLAPEARPNSASPSTSGAAVDGQTPGSAAPAAGESSSTGSTTALAA